MSLLEKLRFGWNMIQESFNVSQEEIESAKNEDVLQTIMSELKENFPNAASVIIDERDRYLTAMLQATARQYQKVPKSIHPDGKVPPVIVAVVGIGHQQGILKLFDTDITSEELAELNNVDEVVEDHATSSILVIASCTILGFVLYKCLKRCCSSKLGFSSIFSSAHSVQDVLKSVKIA